MSNVFREQPFLDDGIVCSFYDEFVWTSPENEQAMQMIIEDRMRRQHNESIVKRLSRSLALNGFVV